MEQILLAYSLSKKTVITIMILYKNTKAMVRSTDKRQILLRHCCWILARRYINTIFAYTLPRLQTLNIHRSNKRKKVPHYSRWYPAETMLNIDYADDLALLINTLAQAKCLLYSLEQAAGGIGIYVKANETEYACFKPNVAISTMWQASKISKPVNISR